MFYWRIGKSINYCLLRIKHTYKGKVAALDLQAVRAGGELLDGATYKLTVENRCTCVIAYNKLRAVRARSDGECAAGDCGAEISWSRRSGPSTTIIRIVKGVVSRKKAGYFHQFNLDFISEGRYLQNGKG